MVQESCPKKGGKPERKYEVDMTHEQLQLVDQGSRYHKDLSGKGSLPHETTCFLVHQELCPFFC
jgi:hypothetical protein